MGKRRTHFLVLLFVLGLVAVSAFVIAKKETKLGLDLKGGVQLVLQGRPTPQQPTIDNTSMERAVDIIRSGCDQLGVSEIEVSRVGNDQIQVGITGAPSVGSPTKQQNQQLLIAGAYPTEYAAAKLASEQKPRTDCENCSQPTTYYLFGKDKPHKLIDGPEFTKEDLYISPSGRKRPTDAGLVVKVPEGTIVVSEKPSDSKGQVLENAEPGWFALKDNPALSGTEITNPNETRMPVITTMGWRNARDLSTHWMSNAPSSATQTVRVCPTMTPRTEKGSASLNHTGGDNLRFKVALMNRTPIIKKKPHEVGSE